MIGFIIGFVLGCIFMRWAITQSLYYIGRHPEMLDRITDKNVRQVLNEVKTKTEDKLTSNPFLY